MSKFPTLKKLWLADCQVDTEGMISFREKGFSSLNLLYLCGNKIEDNGIEDLEELKGLTHVYMKDTKITGSGVLGIIKIDFHKLKYLQISTKIDK